MKKIGVNIFSSRLDWWIFWAPHFAAKRTGKERAKRWAYFAPQNVGLAVPSIEIFCQVDPAFESNFFFLRAAEMRSGEADPFPNGDEWEYDWIWWFLWFLWQDKYGKITKKWIIPSHVHPMVFLRAKCTASEIPSSEHHYLFLDFVVLTAFPR